MLKRNRERMNKPYIVCLKFGTWRNELWFSAPDDEETADKWRAAVGSLPEVSAGCVNSNDFMSAAVEHFEGLGFTRIRR